jgi:uncharacterized protein
LCIDYKKYSNSKALYNTANTTSKKTKTPQKMRHITILFLVFSTTFQISAQVTDTTKMSAKEHLRIYRQSFWESLPKLVEWVNDYDNLLTDEEEAKLNQKIYAFEKETSVEIAIVTIDTIVTSKDKVEDLSLHILETWGIGKAAKNNGVLILVSKGYRRIRVENGYGIEAVLTKEETAEIIQNNFLPSFRQGNYYQGIDNGLSEIIKILRIKMK